MVIVRCEDRLLAQTIRFEFRRQQEKMDAKE